MPKRFLTVILFTLLAASADAATDSYDRVRSKLEARRAALLASYRKAKTNEEKRAVLNRAGQVVQDALTQKILPAWYGTTWAFSGRTSRPKEGEIACGTFVGTVLHHAGFNLNRIAMGRLASEHIALSLTSKKNLRRYRNKDVKAVKKDVQRWGPGIYMVGLDRHAGLLWVKPDRKVRFIHSSYYEPMSVLSEPVVGDNPFADSRYRVLAKLFDQAMMKRWLLGQSFESRSSFP